MADRTEALEEAVSELEAFNYSVSHDLRSPLGAIQNFAAILAEDYRDRPLGREGLTLLGRIQRSASRATSLCAGVPHRVQRLSDEPCAVRIDVSDASARSRRW